MKDEDIERINWSRCLYNMRLHETVQFGLIQIVRVPGGWIYNFAEGGEVFIPYSVEFEQDAAYYERDISE